MFGTLKFLFFYFYFYFYFFAWTRFWIMFYKTNMHPRLHFTFFKCTPCIAPKPKPYEAFAPYMCLVPSKTMHPTLMLPSPPPPPFQKG